MLHSNWFLGPAPGAPRGSYLFAVEFNPFFLERDESPILRRVSKILPKSTLG